jgi:hypothetical protein
MILLIVSNPALLLILLSEHRRRQSTTGYSQRQEVGILIRRLRYSHLDARKSEGARAESGKSAKSDHDIRNIPT